jgi:hypothetical protein
MSVEIQFRHIFGTKPVARNFVVMIKLCRTPKASPLSLRLAVTCAFSVLAACSQGGSNTTGDAAGNGMDNSLADAPPPATALPLASGPAPAYTPARAVSALPPAPSAALGRVPPSDQYAYLNQAYAFSQSLADAPPDYTYDYQGERPWVWQSPDGYYRVAERLPIGVRYFYYAPGASEPYLVQDPQYSYGYSGGMLTVVYGPDGQVLPYDVEARQARDAGLYLAWAAGLYAAARHQEHVAVSRDRWDAERQAVYADQMRWSDAQQHNAAWANYSQAHQNDQAHWADQRYARAAEAARFAQAVNDQAALAHAQQAAQEARTIAQSHGERPPGPAPQGGFDRRQPGGPAFVPPGQPASDLARPPSQQATQRQPPAEQPGPGARGERGPAPAAPAAFERRGQAPVPIRAEPGPAPGGVTAAQHQQALQRQPAADQANAQAEARDRATVQAQTAAASQRQAEQHNAAQGVAQARAQQAAQAAASQAAASRQAEAQVQARQAQAHDQQAAARQTEAATAGRAASDRAAADAHRQAAAQAAAQAQVQRSPPAAAERKAPEPQPRPEAAAPAPRPQAPPPKSKPKPDEPHR